MTAEAQAPRARVIVVGNEKGGSGKSTVAMHVAIALLKSGRKVASLDLDSRQKTFTHYIENRHAWAQHTGLNLEIPDHRYFIENSDHPTAEEESFAHQQHVPATARQVKHAQKAMNNAGQHFSASHARPDIAATERPGRFGKSAGTVNRSAAGDAYEYRPARARPMARAPRAPHPPRGGGGRPPRHR